LIRERQLLLGLAAVAVLGGAGASLVLAGVLLGLAAFARPSVPADAPPRWLEGVVVLGLTAFVLVQTSRSQVWDEPLGVDASTYLRNAWAIGKQSWSAYHRWRGPLDALLILALPMGLIPASKVVSLVATAVTVPASWWLGRETLGPRAALLGTFLLACWPDLWWMGRFSTPYALLMALVVVGLACAASTPRNVAWSLGAGAALSLGITTDLRAQGIAVVVMAIGLLAASKPDLRRPGLALAAAVLAGIVAAKLALAAFPVPLLPLWDQIREHSKTLQDTPGCAAIAGNVIPTDVIGPCSQRLFGDNWLRTQMVVPVGLPLLLALAAAGIRDRRAILVAAPILTLLPTVSTTLLEHRYLLPYVPLLLLLVAAGIDRIAGTTARPWGLVLAPILAGAWLALPTTIWKRATVGEHPHVLPLGATLPVTLATRVIAAAPPEDHLVDCAMADLRVRLYPRDVRRVPSAKGLSAPCAKLLAEGPEKPGATWMMVRAAPADARWDGWETVWSAEEEGRTPEVLGRALLVLRGRR
jgi:hypothetical protein